MIGVVTDTSFWVLVATSSYGNFNYLVDVFCSKWDMSWFPVVISSVVSTRTGEISVHNFSATYFFVLFQTFLPIETPTYATRLLYTHLLTFCRGKTAPRGHAHDWGRWNKINHQLPTVFVVRDSAAKDLTRMSHGKPLWLRQSCQPWHLTPQHVRAATSAFHLLWLLSLSICLFKGFPFSPGKAHFPFPLAQSVSVTSV